MKILVAWSSPRGIGKADEDAPQVKGLRIQLNPATIGCSACSDGRSGSYSFIVPKHKSGQNLFVEMVRVNGLVESIPVSR
ncbi:MAG TPA: hypothetical protein VFC25_00285 [Verrucomicrobiae bacterium]|nr:hypothetical protein [Verrucomicrobiae bacterium]